MSLTLQRSQSKIFWIPRINLTSHKPGCSNVRAKWRPSHSRNGELFKVSLKCHLDRFCSVATISDWLLPPEEDLISWNLRSMKFTEPHYIFHIDLFIDMEILQHMKSMKLVILLHFISWVNSFSDISRKCILPNMIRAGTSHALHAN